MGYPPQGTAVQDLEADIDAVKAKTDNLPSDPADESEVEGAITTAHTTTDGKVDVVSAKTDNLPTDPASQAKVVSFKDFWSDVDDVVDLPATVNGGTDVALPDVVVAGLPTGFSLVRVVAILKVRAIENTNADGANAIKDAQNIRVKKSTGAWGTDDIPAINLADNMWTVAASTRESGDVVVGDIDVKAEVDGNGTYNLRFEDAIVDYDYLRLNDVQVGLRFFFS